MSFAYDSSHRVLDDVNIDAQPGQTIAVLGATASGKSSLVSLIPRFYDVSGGRVTIDGHDIRDVTLESLRNAVGVVLQEPFLFSASIRENIGYGRPDATREEVIEYASKYGSQLAQMSLQSSGLTT